MRHNECVHCGAPTADPMGRRCATCREGNAEVERVAHMRLKTQIAKGNIPPAKRFSCVDCQKPALDYDHRDYTKPFAVEPVCRSCNLKRGAAIWRPMPVGNETIG